MTDMHDRIQGVFRKVASGKEHFWPTGRMREGASVGDVEFRTSSGWTLVFFNDCDGLDCLSSATSPEGVTEGCDDWSSGDQSGSPDSRNPSFGVDGLESALRAARKVSGLYSGFASLRLLSSRYSHMSFGDKNEVSDV